MAYYIRLFTDAPLSTLIPLQAQMIQRGYQVVPMGTNQLNITYDPQKNSLVVELTDANSITTQQIVGNFLDLVQRSPAPQAAQKKVLNVLSRTQALVMIGVPDDYTPTASEDPLEAIISIIANAAMGLFQVDGEGFYEGNELILELTI